MDNNSKQIKQTTVTSPQQGPNEESSSTSKQQKEMTIEEQARYYKDLFIKSKKLILKYEEKIKNIEEANLNLKNKLKEYEAEDGKTCEFLFKFKYENTTFYFFKSDNSYYFLNEKVLDENFRNNLNRNENIKIFDYKKDLEWKDETINQIVNQYEDKMQRLTKELENNEKKILAINEKCKKIVKENEESKLLSENEKKKYEDSIKEIIKASSEIAIQMKNTLEVDLSDDSIQEEVYNKIKEMLNALNKTDDQNYSKWLTELKLFISKTLMTFLDIIFKQITLEKNLFSQKIKWQNTIDQIALSHEEEMKKTLKLVENLKIQIKDLNQKVSILEQEKYNIAKQKDQTIDILSKELNKGVNISYLRNILISFLTSKEESIQDGLLPVIYTTLQFGDLEIKKVQETRANDSNFGNSCDSSKYKTNCNSQNMNLHLSYNSFDNFLTTDVNTVNEINSTFAMSEKNKREAIMSEDLVKKFQLNEFPETVVENFKKFNSKTKQMRKKISNILTSLKKQEKTHNSILEIKNKNFVFLYDINSRINIENDDLKYKKKDDHAMNLNYYNAHRYGNIIKEKYYMLNIKNDEELKKLIRIEKHKKVEDLLDKSEMKKKLLIKKIKIKDL